MKKLSIDIETYSDIDLIRCGVYRYVDSAAFEILLFAYSADDGDVDVIDLAKGEKLTEEIKAALTSQEVVKTAYNAQFERVCLSKYLGVTLDPASWYCTAVQAAELSLPASLADVGAVLGLSRQKMTEGRRLIQYFCVPCRPCAANGERTRNLPEHAPDKWKLFKEYCKRDVEVERDIANRLRKYPISESEHDLYILDQRINDRGVSADIQLAKAAVDMSMKHSAAAKKRARKLTGLENPNSVSQLRRWLSENGVEVDNLSKETVQELINTTKGKINEMLKLRRLMSKTSVTKYNAVLRAVCSDGRVRGLLRFYGANRTGRWSGNILQPQNLPKNNMADLDTARWIVRSGDYELLNMLYNDIPTVLSELIRTVLISKENNRFIVADFSAIEARVLSWLAGEEWRINTFKNGGDIYCASASQMFKVPVEKHGINSHLRQKGKQAELGCGYGGGVGALVNVGTVKLGIPESELPGMVRSWREANPNIVRFWYDVDRAAKKAVKDRTTVTLRDIQFIYESGVLFIKLPGGRRLSYAKPQMGINKFGSPSITYMGIGQSKKWERLETFGGKLVENITQAIARDLLANAMINVTGAGYSIVFHVHDEIIAEMPEGQGSVGEMCQLMSNAPAWADGLPLAADGYTCKHYRKD